MLMVVTGPAASADATYHTQKIPFMPVAAGTSGGGFVVNIHATGLNVFAREEYVVQGGQPLTTYEVTLQVSLANDPTCSAATTIARKRSVFANVLRYAVEREELASDPLARLSWKPPKVSETVDRRVVVNPRQARELLTAVTYVSTRGHGQRLAASG